MVVRVVGLVIHDPGYGKIHHSLGGWQSVQLVACDYESGGMRTGHTTRLRTAIIVQIVEFLPPRSPSPGQFRSSWQNPGKIFRGGLGTGRGE